MRNTISRNNISKKYIAKRDNEDFSPSLFVCGWRPFIGWVCGGALLFEFILRPLIIWFSMIYYPNLPPIPSISDVLIELVFAMLGIGGLRTFEKYKGVTK